MRTDQGSFLFADAAPTHPVASPPGTWLQPVATADDHAARFVRAGAVLAGMPSFELMRVAHAASWLEFERQCEHRASLQLAADEPFALWPAHIEADPELLGAFMASERDPLPSVESVHRTRNDVTLVAVHVPEAGTLELRAWARREGFNVSYSLLRSHAFLPSYADVEPIAAPCELWRDTDIQRLAEATDAPANVSPFSVGGREYIATGKQWHGSRSECRAFAFCAPDDWHGERYDSKSLRRAWDDGRIERGDMRGLVVRVRGQLCVMTALAVFCSNSVRQPKAREEEA